MEFKTKIMKELKNKELLEVNGGNFGHDVGRVLRFLWIAGSHGYNTGGAITDYMSCTC